MHFSSDLKVILMRIEASHLKIGGEVDFGIWGEYPNRFRISLRWNKETQQYEVYKFYFRGKKEEVIFQSKELSRVVQKACEIANTYAQKVYGKPIYNDIAIENGE